MSALTNILISASAGTGKTYQLSLRFLALLALNRGSHPERLIAVTFTRKAAGEFKDRILTDLAAGATDSAGARPPQGPALGRHQGNAGRTGALAASCGILEERTPLPGTFPAHAPAARPAALPPQPLHH